MEIQIEKRDKIYIVRMIGSLDGVTSSEAQEKLMPLVQAKCCLALDLSKCNYISSAGLRLLMMLAKQINTQGGRLALAGVCAEVKDVMDITGFINFFKIYDTIDEIIATMRKEL